MTIMTSNDLHEIIFLWPRTDAKRVIVTGTFDNWAKSLQLTRTATGFSTSVKVPWNSTVAYKYFVDGKWTLDETKPRIIEPEGYVNNVYVAPSRPSRPAPESAGAAAGDVVVQEKVSKLNGHATLDKIQQSSPSQLENGAKDSSIAQAMISVPVDRQQHIAGESTVDQDVAPKAVEKTVEEKAEDSASNPVSPPNGHPVESSAQGTVEEPGTQTGGASTKAGEEMSQTTSPGESKRPIRLPFLPVNVASEGTGNGHLQSGDEMASTHKPLGSLSKPSAASESIPVTSNVPQEPEQQASKVPAASDTPPVEGSAQEGAGLSSEPGEKSIKEGNGMAPAPSGKEPKAPAPPQEAVPPQEEHTVPQSSDAGKATQPTREDKPATLPKATGRASLARSSTGSGKTYFPRVSRESSDSRKSLPSGLPRKKKTSLLQKIKQLFTHHEKEKK